MTIAFTPEEETEIQERLAMGPQAVVDAYFWLGAITALRRGTPIESVKFQSIGERPGFDDDARVLLEHAYAYAKDLGWSVERLDSEIRMAEEHLRRAGWKTEKGVLN